MQATEEEIKELEECGFGGNLPSDRVALFFEDKNLSVEVLLDYCRRRHDIGFECYIDEEDVKSFIDKNSPD